MFRILAFLPSRVTDRQTEGSRKTRPSSMFSPLPSTTQLWVLIGCRGKALFNSALMPTQYAKQSRVGGGPLTLACERQDGR